MAVVAMAEERGAEEAAEAVAKAAQAAQEPSALVAEAGG